MIPHIAYFYWAGTPIPWIRRQSLISFRDHHPGWDVVLGSPEEQDPLRGIRCLRDTITDPTLPPVARSDVWRYQVLAETGGFYADTDVIFTRNVTPLFEGKRYDAWITLDMGTPVPCFGWCRNSLGKRMGRVEISIGVLAGVPGSPFFERAAVVAKQHPPKPDYQCFGTQMLASHWPSIASGSKVGNIPAGAFYQGSTNKDVSRLWKSGDLESDIYGLHWYGGSPESAPYMNALSLEDLPDSLVRDVIILGRSHNAESD